MIFYLRNNRVIARFKRIDNARPHRRQRPLEEESCSETENESHTGKRELQWSARGSMGPAGESGGYEGAGQRGWKGESRVKDGEGERRGEEVKGEL